MNSPELYLAAVFNPCFPTLNWQGGFPFHLVNQSEGALTQSDRQTEWAKQRPGQFVRNEHVNMISLIWLYSASWAAAIASCMLHLNKNLTCFLLVHSEIWFHKIHGHWIQNWTFNIKFTWFAQISKKKWKTFTFSAVFLISLIHYFLDYKSLLLYWEYTGHFSRRLII